VPATQKSHISVSTSLYIWFLHRSIKSSRRICI
jgi:hypothetical protein